MTESGQGIFVKGVTWPNIYLQSVFNWRVLLIYDDNIKMCSVGMDQNCGSNQQQKKSYHCLQLMFSWTIFAIKWLTTLTILNVLCDFFFLSVYLLFLC